MSALDRAPVIAGVAQVEQRSDDPHRAREPLDLMEAACRAAADDAGAPGLLRAATSVRVIFGMWPYQNPARILAERLGLSRAETAYTSLGGNMVQEVVSQTALDIERQQHEVVIIAGAECGRTVAQAERAGIQLEWSHAAGVPDRVFGDRRRYLHDREADLGLDRALVFYPLFENALRFRHKATLAEHQKRISELWAKFSDVAAGNPHAWLRQRFTAEEIRTISSANRAVTFPYPKLMNSNNRVDQGAALLVCSQSAAQQHGVPTDKLVYPLVGTSANDTLFVSHRDNLYSSPAIRIAGRKALELVDMNVKDVELVDVYSCFPCAVQIAAAEFGLSLAQPLTVTGGLTFAGGPHNNYVMHSIATMVDRLREAPGKKGLVTANGGYLTKHAFGVYSTEPPSSKFRYADVQPDVDRTPRRDAAFDYRGPVTTESYSVVYREEEPHVAHVACRTPDGRRSWGNATDRRVVRAMTEEEFCGRPARLDGRAGIDFE